MFTNQCVLLEQVIQEKHWQKQRQVNYHKENLSRSCSWFSSYGNQIGLTTGYVHEIYDEGYIAKRMEVGAVVAAAPKEQVKRLEPQKWTNRLINWGTHRT